jgi:hypothetical protein
MIVMNKIMSHIILKLGRIIIVILIHLKNGIFFIENGCV